MSKIGLPNFVVIGCPENRRITFFQAALHRLDLGKASVISWLDWLTGKVNLERVINRQTILRTESAGENFAVERELITMGAEVHDDKSASFISADVARHLDFDCGRIRNPHQHFLGLQIALRRLQSQLEASPPALLMNQPQDIERMFDKPRCHALLTRNGISTAPSLGQIHSYEHLRQVMKASGHQRVFIKLACGSSASGVIAYETNWQREQAWTSIELVRRANEIVLYNSLRVRRFSQANEIAAMVDWLCAEGVQVERWIPKYSLAGCATDLRVVVIDGQPAHTVLRSSRHPLTNLHLGNTRGDLPSFIRRIGESAWQQINETCKATARCFPGSLYAGIDIGLTVDAKRAVVFEVNAFGDLLPNVLFGDADTYELEALVAKQRYEQLEERDEPKRFNHVGYE